MPPKLYKAADVCDMAQVQPYVLRSWEKEFPGIGVQKTADGPRLYRQSDIDQVLRIKQLVFGEGLTLSGARRRMEESGPVVTPPGSDGEVHEGEDTLTADVRVRIAHVRDGLQSLLRVLSSAPGAPAGADDFQLDPPPAARSGPVAVRTAARVIGKVAGAEKTKRSRAHA